MSLFERPLYRTRQFFGSIRPRIDSDERAEAAELLGERLWPLFASMTERDQRHSLDVLRVLKERGCRDQDLLMAALLHDAGKGRLAGVRIRLWHRVAYVLIASMAPWSLRRLENGRGGLAALHQHAERGAVVAEALGAPPAVVDLVRRHEKRDSPDERLRLLRAADDAC
jgi:hypothetical protein